MKKINLIGQQFNNLTVIEAAPSNNGTFWKCQCSCGNFHVVRGSNLRSGYTTKCKECQKAKDFTGLTFGKLYVIRKIDRQYNQNRYECRCECGKKHISTQSSLRRGLATKCFSCATRKDIFGIPKHYLSELKKNAIDRNLEFTVSPEYLGNLIIKQNYKCSLSGLDIQFRINNNKTHTASLDRIDSKKGYIENNVQWVHKIVNKIKQDLNEKEFVQMCVFIAENTKEFDFSFIPIL